MSTTYAGANAFPATITIPDDGDDEDASSVDAALEGLADRTKNLDTRLTPVEADTAVFGLYTATTARWLGYAEKTYDNDGAVAEAYVTSSFAGGLANANETFASLEVGDFVIVDVTGTALLIGSAGSGHNGMLRLHFVQDSGGAAVASDPTSARVVLDQPGRFPFALTASIQISHAGTFQARVQGLVNSFSELDISNAFTMRITVFRIGTG